jgi:hypothetical protein
VLVTDLDERLRTQLLQAADAIPVPPLPSGADYRAVHNRRRRPAAALVVTAAAAVIAVLAVVVVTLAHEPTGIPTSGASYTSWPARGNLAGDRTLALAAMRSWDAAPLPLHELPHRDVAVLFAAHTVAGDTVVLRGRDARGRDRIAWFCTDAASTTPFRHRLHLLSDALAPTGNHARLLTFVAPRPTPRPTDDTLLIALAAPGTRTLEWHNDQTRWQPMTAVDGAAAEVVGDQNGFLNTWTRIGTSGSGTRTTVWLAGGGFRMIEHDLDPEDERPSTSSSANESCAGSVCSSSVSGHIYSAGSRIGDWTDLRSDRPTPLATPYAEWDEFAAEARQMAQSRHRPDGGESGGPRFSRLLPDGTGVYLQDYTPGGGTERLVLYVDRPEWYGGRLGADLDATAPQRAVATLALVKGKTHLVAIVTDGLRLQWSADGHHWTGATVHDHVVDEPVPMAGGQWRAIAGDGTVVGSGALREAGADG